MTRRCSRHAYICSFVGFPACGLAQIQIAAKSEKRIRLFGISAYGAKLELVEYTRLRRFRHAHDLFRGSIKRSKTAAEESDRSDIVPVQLEMERAFSQ